MFTLLEMVQFSNMQACDDYRILCFYLSNLVVVLDIKPTNLSHLSFSYGLSFSQHWNTSNQEKLVILCPVHQDKFVEGPWNNRKSGSPATQLRASGSGTPVITAPLLTYTGTRRQTHAHIHEQFQMTYHYHVSDHSCMPRHRPPLVSLTIYSHCPGKHSSSLTCVFVSQLDEALWDVPSPVETDHLCLHIATCSLKGTTNRVTLRELHTVSGDSEPNTSVNQYWKSLNLRLQSIMFNQQCNVEFINTCCVCTPPRSNEKKRQQ